MNAAISFEDRLMVMSGIVFRSWLAGIPAAQLKQWREEIKIHNPEI
jgi:hypothetical protein